MAGLFYLEAPAALRAQIHSYLTGAAPSAIRAAGQPRALIVPHAGYVYSGSVAACAYRRLADIADGIHRVVLFGPAHRRAVRGLALPSATFFATPLGKVEVDRVGVAAARALPQVCESDAAHDLEHALEVQLPFLQVVLREFRILPFVVGDATPAEVAQVIELFADDPAALILVSSDLSHYHPYAEAQEVDQGTANTVLALSPTLNHQQACGATPINGLLLVARRRGLRPELLSLANSGDAEGDRSRVVGYGSFAFDGPAPALSIGASAPGRT